MSSSNAPASPDRPSSVHRASHSRTVSFSPRRSASPVSITESPAVDRRASYVLPARSSKRGMTMDELETKGMLDDKDSSSLFADAPISDEEIKKLPRKLRPYYKKLAQIHEHYLEVEGLLSGEMPSTIANSFQTAQARGRQADDSPCQPNGRAKSGSHGRAGSNDEEADEHTALLNASEKEEKRERVAKIALNVNTAVNVLLVAAKAIAVLYSSSISLTASLVDSALDLLSTFIILGTTWAIGMKRNQHLYPAGKRRFEPLGVLIFSVAMIASFVQVFIESFERAIGRKGEASADLSWVGIGTMLATIGVKSIIWVWCSKIPSSGVQALAQDAENDVWFNIMSLSFPWLGTRLKTPLLDPIGGMVLSTYIIVEWVKTLLQNFGNLSGRSAEGDQVTRVLYLVTRFNPVLEIGDVECYHIGDELIVEVDVILPHTSTLHFAHDVGETIQCVLEGLDGVIRAYVHCDYSARNPPQHTTRQAGTTASKVPSRSSSGYGSNSRAGSRSNSMGEGSSSGSATPRPRFLAGGLGLSTSPSAQSDQKGASK